jgi:hypothetical protein
MANENRPKHVTLKTIVPMRWDGEHREPGFLLEKLSPGDANYFIAERRALPPADADNHIKAAAEQAAKSAKR